MTGSLSFGGSRTGKGVFLSALFSALLGACGGDSTGVTRIPQVAGATYDLRSAGGASLPTDFEDCNDPPEGITDAQITSGGIQFGTTGRLAGFYLCDAAAGGNRIPVLIEFNYRFQQDGAQVLINRFGDDFAPDTGTVSGDSLTVRAQFFGAPGAQQRFVVPLVYVRR